MAVWNVIAEDTLGAAASSFTLSSISSSYDHLYMVVSARDDKSAYYNNLEFRFNNTSTPYSNTYLYASTTTVSGTRDTSGAGTGDVISVLASDSTLADTFSTTTLWIPNYSNTSNDKPCIISSVVPNSSASDNQWFIEVTAGLWASTSAIDQIRVKPNSSPQFQQYTSYVLYGINGAS